MNYIAKRLIRLFSIILTVIVLGTFSSLAESINDISPASHVNDYANILNDNLEKDINSRLEQLEASTTNQFVIVTVNNLDGDYIENYAVKLFEKIKPCTLGVDNGVLLLISKDDRKVRLEVGYGLEGVLTDSISSDIINKIILPNFKSGNFEAGVNESSQQIVNILNGEVYEIKESKISKDTLIVGLIMIPFLLMFQVIFTLNFNPGWARYTSSMLTGGVLGIFPGTFFGKYGFLSWFVFALLIAFIFRKTKVKQSGSNNGGNSNHWGGGSGWGGGSSGGFSGGGGRSGGGGASGSW